MGHPRLGAALRPHLGRFGLIGLMLAGGLLSAGISQAQDVGDQDVRAERAAELIAAAGGPASPDHLAAFASDRAAVEQRDDDVAPAEVQPTATPIALPTAAAAEPTRRVATADTASAALPNR